MTEEESSELLEEEPSGEKPRRKASSKEPAGLMKKRSKRLAPAEAKEDAGAEAPPGPPELPLVPAGMLASIREQLLAKRDLLARQQATQLRALYSADKHHLADLEEMASDTSETDSVCASVDLSSSTIEQIDTALERLRAGVYGVCERCNKAIHPERLEALPFTSLCLRCQRKKEERLANAQEWEE